MLNSVPAGVPNPRSEWSRDLLSGAILAVAFVVCATLSWRTWPDVIVDFGQELYVPWRLSAGEVLYRDIAWVTGPFSQYANAVLFRVLGVSLTTLIVANLALLAGIVAMLYGLFRQCGTRASATGVCLFFLLVFAFAQYSLIGNYNYICPYRHDITHGVALGLIHLHCLLRFSHTRSHTRSPGWLLAGGVLLGLLSLTKIEMTLAAGLATAVALPLFAWQRHRAGGGDAVDRPGAVNEPQASLRLKLTQAAIDVLRWSMLMVAGASVPVAVAVAAFASVLGWRESARQIFLQYLLAVSPTISSSSGFYRSLIGTDDISGNLLDIALTSLILFGVAVIGYIVEIALGASKPAPIRSLILAVFALLGGLYFSAPDWHGIPIGLPVFLLPIILITGRAALRGSASDTVLLLTAVYGLGLLPKVLLHVRWSHYGFVLAMPGTLVVIHFLCQHLPAMWNRRQQGAGQTFQAVAAGLFTACALTMAWSWVRIDGNKLLPVGTGGDLFYAEPRFDERALSTVNTLAYLQDAMAPTDTMIVFPNGTMLNYLLRKRNPTPYLMFSPWESDVHGGEDKIADSVIHAAPDYAVIVTMDLTIHGRGNFGSPEFGGRIVKHLSQHYDVVFQDQAKGTGGLYMSTVLKRHSRPVRATP